MGDTDRRLRTFQWGKEVVGIQKMRCSNSECRKRVCDIWETRFGVVVIELKCRHCGEIVRVYWKPRGKK